MEPTEKDIVIEKIKELPPEHVSKVLIFIAGLEAGSSIVPILEEGDRKHKEIANYSG